MNAIHEARQALRGFSSRKRRGSPRSCEVFLPVPLTHSHSQGHSPLALSNPLGMEAAARETGGATAGLIKGIVRTV